MTTILDQINRESAIPVFRQIENLVCYAVSGGVLKEGDTLPAMHVIAEQLELNQNTVHKAIHDLEQMGVLTARRGTAASVAKGAAAKCQKRCREAIATKLYETVREAKAAGMTDREVTTIVKAVMDADTSPYAPAPKSLLRLA